jgi:hypothetical protein
LRNLYFWGSGTFGTTSIELTGAPTGARVVTFPDSSTSIPISSQTLTFTGPSAARTFTLPDAAATILTSNAAVTVAQGGTGIASGTSGGVPYFSGSTSIASSGALTANALVLGGGAGTAPAVLGSLGTTTTVLHGNAAGAPTFGAVALGTDVSGQLPLANGGFGQSMTGMFGSGTKSLGAGNIAATGFLRSTLTSGNSSSIVVMYKVVSNDGSGHLINWGGTTYLGCVDASGTTTAVTDTFTQGGNGAGVVSAAGSLSGSLSFSTATASDTCDLRLAITYTPGSGTAASVTYIWFSADAQTVTGL